MTRLRSDFRKHNAVIMATLAIMCGSLVFCAGRLSAQDAGPASPPEAQPSAPIEAPVEPQPIEVDREEESFEDRLDRKITLDVRDMSVVDVLRFLAMKGNFNIIVPGNLQGRITLFLKRVSIRDALEITVLSNRLAYVRENEIIRIMTEQEYEAIYGKTFSDRREVEIVNLSYAKPSYVLATLEGVKSRIGQIIIDEETGNIVLIDTPESLEKMLDVLKKVETRLETHVYPIQFAKADVLAEQLRNRLGDQSVAAVSADERTNKIMVRAYPERLKEIETLITNLDAPTKEVVVEARILQVVFKPQLDFGIDWSLDFRNSNYQLLRRTSFQTVTLDEDNLSSSDNLFQKFGRVAIGDFDSNKFETAIRALKQVSDTRILSNPKILVTNNEEAKIHIGDTVPYIISTTSGTGDNAITSEDVRFVDVGLKLNVTPTINDDGWVTMVLKPEISTVTGSIQSEGGGIPQVNKTLLETTVMVQDGMTIVLGGLKKDNKVQKRSGIPILMDLPLLSKLFSSTSDSIESTEIVIFITPDIVRGNENRYRNDPRISIKPSRQYDRDEVKELEPKP